MPPARILAAASSALAILALSGCASSWGCTDTTAKRGAAGVSVQVVDASGQLLGVTAKVVDWRLEPHPQQPDAGDKVHFHYRFDGADETSGPAVDACVVDKKRVAMICTTVYSSEAFGPNGTGDAWLTVDHPDQVAAVLLIPNDQSHDDRTCEQDVKDGGGPHPPKSPKNGDQL
ncbi:hypothetical protein [Streptomyces sp. LaPpAH-108]|uniref:hypothetical protein n=1 Tax=Streptomyces sp. LaPpAH-108 TaxID=1155714 RepID=UPI0003695D5D|nr:hypothetical protein [Streptomyces sp. LaPpAH-108]